MNRKLALTAIIIFTLLYSLVAEMQFVEAEPRTIVVPTDYPTIQEALNASMDSDTVFVKRGTYIVDENTPIVIDKTLSLIGEDPKNTIIFGSFSKHPEDDVAIRVAAPNVTISSFTITNCLVAIAIVNYYSEPYPSSCKIINNNIVNNLEGIRPQRNGLLISRNSITKNQGGITGYNTENIIITGNNISENGYGINIGICRNITVSENQISGNTGGLNLPYYGPYLVYGNNITNNNWGIRFAEGCSNANVYGNNIAQNDVGVMLLNFPNGGDVVVSGVGNQVFGNLFIDNTIQVSQDELNYNIPDTSWSMGTDIVSWDNRTIGNYWDDYGGLDENGDGIGDTAYIIDENNQDNYPLMVPNIIPEFPSWIILPLFVSVTLVRALVRKKQHLSKD